VLRHVHERYDGTGYPDRLAGERIPLASRILHAAITFEAMVSPRPYRDPVAVDLAREELRRVAGAQLDPDVVVALEDVLESAPPEWSHGAGDRKQPFRSGSGLPG
jgi:HD-GYP domain-containing protein (c-di-GMP phosphodiesterase class II)